MEAKVIQIWPETGGQKRQRDDDQEEEQTERPSKKPRFDLSYSDSPGLPVSDTPTKSATYSNFYLPSVDSAYSSYHGESGVSPSSSGLMSPTGKLSFTSTPDKQWATLKDLFRRKYKLLKDELEPKHGLADKLYATVVLSDKDMESIKEEPSRSRRADILIKSLVHSSKSNIFGLTSKIFNAFTEEKLDYLLSPGEQSAVSPVTSLPLKHPMTPDSEMIISELQFLAKGLEDNLEPRDIIDDLLVSGFLSFMDHEDIYVTPSRHTRVKILVDHVKRGGRKNFSLFETALKASYPELANQLKNKQLDSILPLNELSLELMPRHGHISTVPANERNTNRSISANMMELKLNTIGENSASDVEMSAVISNNSVFNLLLEEEAMEIGSASLSGFEYSSIRIKFDALSEETVSKFIDLLDNNINLQRLVNQIFTQEQLQTLKERDIQKVNIELLVPERSLIAKKCTCRLSKKFIVKYFTFMERELQDVTSYLKVFSSSKLIDFAAREEFSQMNDGHNSSSTKTEAFLRKLLSLPERAICLFEKQIKANGQLDLLRTVTEKDKDTTTSYRVGPKEIRRNLTFLQNEIEPKLFVSCVENKNIRTEDIISSDQRKIRCKRFVEAMLKEGQTAIDRFIKDLERQNMTFVLDVLCRKENENKGVSTEDIRKNVLSNYAYLVNEIEPTRLRQKLVQERVFKAPEFDEILKVSTQRRGRVVWLLRKLLQKEPSCLLAFIDALKIANYLDIAAKMLDVSEDNADCPFMMSAIGDDCRNKSEGKDITYTAEYLVNWTKEIPTESELQLSLHKAIYQTSEVDKAKYTENWVQNQQEHQTTDDEFDFNKENKYPENTDTEDGRPSNHKIHDELTEAIISCEFSDDHNAPGSTTISACSINVKACRGATLIRDTLVQSKSEDVTPSRSTEEEGTKIFDDGASIPSVGGNGRQSPYTNEFEDITPCQSPDVSLPFNNLASDFCGPYYKQDFLLQLMPISPCGSGGTACNSDTLSPTQSPTIMQPRVVRSHHKEHNRGQRK